jgi:hypothetical protein
MKERPILFSGAMVQAILGGSKTQTRRAVNNKHIGSLEASLNLDEFAKKVCPYGTIGDRLWVRETWADIGYAMFTSPYYVYRATDPEWDENESWRGWKSPIFMPRIASRITLEIVDIKVERVQDISEQDAIAEGVEFDQYSEPPSPCDGIRAFHAYAKLWDSINGKTYPWDSNPWVWTVVFKRV